ncbi:Far11p [Sugiyamaella lignohabitans]|uniref:Far11p n=1 Tax=Sugiyamaella lignohabitans TaxID=796027 RepID=A0A167DW40_9ASCO|nr:Far11p [Sugiyamaella lignohabitans]ANB13362.1 Far11p [Sugiyamaella lignohabitans]
MEHEVGLSEAGRINLDCLVYIAQGAYGEVNDQKQHILQIKENCKLIWRSAGLPVIWKQITRLIDLKLPNSPAEDSVDETEVGIQVNDELILLLTIFYLIVETLRDEKDDTFVSDLDSLEPPVLSHLIDVVGRLRWVSNKQTLAAFPVTKINLIIWKCILVLFGGRSQMEEVKAYMRQKYGLPKEYDENIITASPLDYHAFRDDLISRYPSYVPPPSHLPKTLENTQSISHFIQVARPSHTQPSNTALPAPTIHIATPAPSPPMSPAMSPGQKLRKSVFMTNQSFPFLYPTDSEVPQSIVEAGELFASRIRTTPALVQLWEERDKFMRYERGWDGEENQSGSANSKADSARLAASPNKSQIASDTDERPKDNARIEVNSEHCQNILGRVDKVYRGTLLTVNSFLNVQLRLMLKSNVFLRGRVDDSSPDEIEQLRCKDVTMKSISAILDLLLLWYKVDHILKFEYLSVLLFDARYYLFVYKYLYSHNVLEKALFVSNLDCTFFNASRHVSDEWVEVNGITTTSKNQNNSTANGHEYGYDGLADQEVDHVSNTYLFTLINLVRVLRKIVKHKTQRVIIVAELPSETLKQALTVYQEDLWKTVLDLFKEQVPFNGKKWKFNNMDLISAIYLNCKAKLRDDWLSGIDVNAEIDDAYPQEVALRSLVKFFNDHSSTSGDQIDQQHPDFFAQELEALTISSN